MKKNCCISLFLILGLFFLSGCASTMGSASFGYDYGRGVKGLLNVKSGAGKKQLDNILNFDTPIRNFVNKKGPPDYIDVENFTVDTSLIYFKENKVYYFKRNQVTLHSKFIKEENIPSETIHKIQTLIETGQ